MANRTMLQKLKKLKDSQKKAHLKKPRSGGVDQGKIAANEIFQNRSRVNTTQGKSHEMLPLLDNTWTKEVPATISRPENAFTVREVKKSYYDWNHKGERVRVEETVEEYGPSEMSKLHAQRQTAKEETKHLLDKLQLMWQGSRRQGVSVFHTITLMGGGDHSLKAYFSGNEWVFVLETPTHRMISKVYTREQAQSAWQPGKSRIAWMNRLDK